MSFSNHQKKNPTDERIALLALHNIPGIGSFLIKQLIAYCGSATEVFRTRKGTLLKIPYIGNTSANAIKMITNFETAEKQLNQIVKSDCRILFFTEAAFPQRLKHFDDSPSLLYVRGNIDLNAQKTVGIVGTRQATHYGKKIVEQLVEDLAVHHPLIVSGLAYGIDVHAHKQALVRNIPTLGVMASGIDIIYPATHKKIAARMLEKGGLATEHPPGKGPEVYNFPVRNRIIAGLSDALIVVETAEKGGALITAEIANSYNKDVFAVPGAIGQPYSTGCNKLIKTHKANLLTSARDIEYIMGWDTGYATKKSTAKPIDKSLFSPDEQKVITLLQIKQGAMTIDEMSRKSSLPPGNLAALLLNLELKHVVRLGSGKKYHLDG